MSATRRPPALIFGSDGMRHDLMMRYAVEGVMPVVAELLRRGTTARHGALPTVPSNTGAGWPTLLTGAWPGVTGAINNIYHRTDTPITQPASGFDATLIAAETLPQVAERQGLRVAQIEWPGTLPATCAGPVVDFRAFYAVRGAAFTSPPAGLRLDLARRLGLLAQQLEFQPARAWRTLPASALPPQEARFDLPTAAAGENPPRTYYLLAYAARGGGYDTLLVAPQRDAAAAVARLAPGEWAEVRVALADGRTAGFHLKLIALAPDLSRVWLYATTLSRSRASAPDLEEWLNRSPFPVAENADHGPLECGLIDVETYVEQALMFFPRAEQVSRAIVERQRPDLLVAAAPVTDEFSHQFLGLTLPACPRFDPARAREYAALIREAYARTDRYLGYLIALMREIHGAEPLVAVTSDHGFSAAWLSINANFILERAGLLACDAAGKPLPESQAVAYWAGGFCSVYINLAGREPGGIVPPARYAEVQDRIVRAFRALNEDAPLPPIAAVKTFAETATIPTSGGTASLQFPGRTGDVVVFAAPPYQFDAPTPGEVIALSPLYGQHGYLPDTVDPRFDCDLRSPFLLAGPGVPTGHTLEHARAIDLAPTVAALLGIPAPCHAQGRALLT